MMSHFSSTQQLEIGDELLRRAKSVSHDLRFCVVSDADVSVEDGVDNSVSKESSEDACRVRNCRPSRRRSPLLPLSATSAVCAKLLAIFRSLRPRRWAMRFRVSQDLRFCVVVDGSMPGRVVDVPVVMLDRASCDATPRALRRGAWWTALTTAASARTSSEDVFRCLGTVAPL